MTDPDDRDWVEAALIVVGLLILLCIVGALAAGAYYAWKRALNG